MGHKRLLAAVSLALIALTAGTAAAALFEPGGEGATGPGIELADSDNSTAGRLARMLDDTNQPGMNESILKRHTRSTTKAGSTMEGHYTREGGETASLLEERGVRNVTGQFPSYAGNDSIPSSVALAAGAHVVDSGASVSAPVVAASSGSTVAAGSVSLISNGNGTGQPTSPITGNGNGQTPVPLPPAALLLASGLFGLPAVQRSRRSGN